MITHKDACAQRCDRLLKDEETHIGYRKCETVVGVLQTMKAASPNYFEKVFVRLELWLFQIRLVRRSALPFYNRLKSDNMLCYFMP